MSLSEPPNFSSKEARKNALEKLNLAMKLTGLSASALASEIGLSKSTFTRFLRGKEKHILSHKTLTALGQFVSERLETESKFDQLERWKNTSVADQETSSKTLASVIAIKVHGAVEAGNWKEAIEWDMSDRETIFLPKTGPDKSVFALVVSGNSMDLVYPEGTYLICLPIYSYGKSLKNGDHVIVQQSHEGLVEATVKEFYQNEEGEILLRPQSTDPQHQEPILLPAPFSYNHESTLKSTQVIAVVIGDYRVRMHS